MKVGILEGLLFVVGEEGLEVEKIESILDVTYEELKDLIKQLCDVYADTNRGLQLLVLGNKLKLTTKKEHKEYYEKLIEEEDSNLSQAALETLAIIAYNEPITRIKVDEIRGINSSHMVRKLLSKNLIKEKGRSDQPGRPILYGVTDEFLDYFGLSSTSELPKLTEIEKIDIEEDLYHTRYNDEKEN